MKEGFFKCLNEQTLFTKQNKEGNMLIVSVYVDDLIYTGDDEGMMIRFKKSMMQVFEMTDLGKNEVFPGH